jgi:hypothetical protein
MGRKSKFSEECKNEACKDCDKGIDSLSGIDEV